MEVQEVQRIGKAVDSESIDELLAGEDDTAANLELAAIAKSAVDAIGGNASGETSRESSGGYFNASLNLTKSLEMSDHTFVLGPVLVPEVTDFQGDIVSAEEIERVAHEFTANSMRAGLMHSTLLAKRQTEIVESYITRGPTVINGETIPAGSWVVGMKVYDMTLRKYIRDGVLAAFSIGGHATKFVIEDDPNMTTDAQ